MARDWIDADFEVIQGELRVGDPHPSKPGWRYVGVDATGRELWREPPRLRRWQLAAVLCAGLIGLQAAVFVIAEAAAHH